MIDIARLERILSRRTVAPDRETLVTRSAHLGQAMRTIGTYYPELWNGVDRDDRPPQDRGAAALLALAGHPGRQTRPARGGAATARRGGGVTDDEYEASDAGRRYADPLRSPWTWAALVVCALLWVAVLRFGGIL